jgi:hypothetical protein
MKTDQQLRDYINLHPNMTATRIRSNLRYNPDVTVARIHALRGKKDAPTAALKGPPPAPSRLSSKPFKLLLEEFDDVAKVRKAMKSLSRSDYIDDDEFRRTLKIGDQRWREVRRHQSLSVFLFILPNKRPVWMHPETQETLKKAIDLSSQ